LITRIPGQTEIPILATACLIKTLALPLAVGTVSDPSLYLVHAASGSLLRLRATMKRTLTVFGALAAAAISQATIVYDDLTGQQWGFYTSSTYMADDVNLVGTDRFVTSVDVGFTSSVSFNGQVTANLYTIVGSGDTWTIGTLIGGGSTVVNVPGSVEEYFTSVPIADIQVPSSLVVVIGVLDGGSILGGVLVGNEPTVGTSANRYAYGEPDINGVTQWTYVNAGITPRDIAIRVNAVPEPTTVAALALGIAALTRKRRIR
jgi:hypothetical protein